MAKSDFDKMDEGGAAVMNKKYQERIAGDLRAEFDGYLAGGDSSEQAVAQAWQRVAKKAMERMNPVLIGAELPNDAYITGRRTPDDAAQVDVGNPSEHGKNTIAGSGVPEEAGSGERKPSDFAEVKTPEEVPADSKESDLPADDKEDRGDKKGF